MFYLKIYIPTESRELKEVFSNKITNDVFSKNLKRIIYFVFCGNIAFTGLLCTKLEWFGDIHITFLGNEEDAKTLGDLLCKISVTVNPETNAELGPILSDLFSLKAKIMNKQTK